MAAGTLEGISNGLRNFVTRNFVWVVAFEQDPLCCCCIAYCNQFQGCQPTFCPCLLYFCQGWVILRNRRKRSLKHHKKLEAGLWGVAWLHSAMWRSLQKAQCFQVHQRTESEVLPSFLGLESAVAILRQFNKASTGILDRSICGFLDTLCFAWCSPLRRLNHEKFSLRCGGHGQVIVESRPQYWKRGGS